MNDSITKIKMIALENVESFNLTETVRLRLKDRLKTLSLSVKGLAEKTNGKVSYGYANKIIHGQHLTVKKDKFFSICDALNLEVEDILNCSTITLVQK